MNFLKKWINSIVLFITGALGLLLSLCTGLTLSVSVAGTKVLDKAVKAHKIVTDSNLVDEAKLYGVSSEFSRLKVFAIIGVIVSIILVIYAIVLLLKNLNVIKCENKIFDIIALVLPVVLLVVIILVLVFSNLYASSLKEPIATLLSLGTGAPLTVIKVTAKIGVYQPLMIATSAFATIIIGTFAFLKAKQK
jgi:hypothetical protein